MQSYTRSVIVDRCKRETQSTKREAAQKVVQMKRKRQRDIRRVRRVCGYSYHCDQRIKRIRKNAAQKLARIKRQMEREVRRIRRVCSTSKKVLLRIRNPGALTAVGYKIHEAAHKRHAALKRLMKQKSPQTIMRMLTVLSTWNKHRPRLHSALETDKRFVRSFYA